MNEKQRRELDAISDAAALRRRPVIDYGRMSPREFVLTSSAVRTVEIFSTLLVEAGASRAGRISDHERGEIVRLSDPPLTEEETLDPVKQLPVRDKLSKLANYYFEPELFWILAECMSERPYFIAEWSRRRRDHPLAVDLFIVPAVVGVEMPSIEEVRKLLTKTPAAASALDVPALTT